LQLTHEQALSAISAKTIIAPTDPAAILTSITWDSREVAGNSVFLTIKGEKVDGNDFILAALESGAAFIIATAPPCAEVCERAELEGATLVQAENAELALQELAVYYRRLLAAKVIGITGSSGKTTTKDLVASVLSQKFATVATSANQNNELGVPNTILSAEPSTEVLVVEMGMRGLGQIEKAAAIAKPDIGVITNIGSAHEELLGSRENIAIAKAELFLQLPPQSGIAILHAEDDFTNFITSHVQLEEREIELLQFAIEGDDVFNAKDASAKLTATNLKAASDGSYAFTINNPFVAPFDVKLHLAGRHNVLNALIATAIALKLGLTPAEIQAGLEAAAPASNRQQLHELPNGAKIIDDSYNANPDSMRAALDLLASHEVQGKRIAILGDMGELGTHSPKYHADIGEYATKRADVLITIGELACNIANGAASCDESDVRIFSHTNIEEAIGELREIMEAGDVILVKASRFMQLDLLVKRLIEE
jgi:UDP-N-acetylmuramoyl-tripeptide--D-alanyl-D-alanine ligase